MTNHISEYQKQLAEVENLLQSVPDDSSLLSLKSDLMELIHITQQGVTICLPPDKSEKVKPNKTTNVLDNALRAAVDTSVDEQVEIKHDETSVAANTAILGNSFVDAIQVAASVIPPSIDVKATKEFTKKKSKRFQQDFEVPRHLIPLETDSATERNKKHRAIKALKGKWRESKKAAESAQKQKSWQSFQKKKKLKNSSMFSTVGGDTSVGVVVAKERRQNEE